MNFHMLTKSVVLITLVFGLCLSVSVQAEEKEISPETVVGATTIDVKEAKRLFDQGTVFLDVRSQRDWDAGRIPGSAYLELKHIFTEESLAAVVARDKPVVIYCNSIGCMRSSHACAKAVGWGFKQVYYFREGYPAWQEAGYAIE